MSYDFLLETHETELVKVLSAWSEFRDETSATSAAERSIPFIRVMAIGRRRLLLPEQIVRHCRELSEP
jgi:hypothetical protein